MRAGRFVILRIGFGSRVRREGPARITVGPPPGASVLPGVSEAARFCSSGPLTLRARPRAPVTASALPQPRQLPLVGSAAPEPRGRAARLSLFGHAAAAVLASGRAAPRGRQREAGAPRGDGDACGRGSSPVPATGEPGDLSAAPPQRLRWLKRRSTRKPTRGASAAPPPWPTAQAACWRAWTSWSSGEAAAGSLAGAVRGGAARAQPPGRLQQGSCLLGTCFLWRWCSFVFLVDFPFLA